MSTTKMQYVVGVISTLRRAVNGEPHRQSSKDIFYIEIKKDGRWKLEDGSGKMEVGRWE